MTKRLSYNASTEAVGLIERIQAARPMDRVTVADAINYALRFTVTHDQEVREMDERIESILYQYATDDAALFGASADLTLIDIVASYNAYEDAVLAALRAAYPGIDVIVQSGPDRIVVNGLRDHNEVPWVEDVAREAWERFDWIRVDAEKLAALVAMVTVGDPTPVGETSVVWLNEDGTYSVSDNGEEVSSLTETEAVRIVMENEGWSRTE